MRRPGRAGAGGRPGDNGKRFALVPDVTEQTAPVEQELTEPEKRENVIRLAFGGNPANLERFIELIRNAIPENTGVVLRGSAVTGYRWKDKAPFDADGPGTSDLDLTLVGHRILSSTRSPVSSFRASTRVR